MTAGRSAEASDVSTGKPPSAADEQLQVPPEDVAAVCSAFALGWQMAELYLRPFPRTTDPPPPPPDLPGIGSLSPAQLVELGLDQVDVALHDLGDRIRAVKVSVPTTGPVREVLTSDDPDAAEGSRQIYLLHVALLKALTAADYRLGKAYGLGRALADTCRPAPDQAALRTQLGALRLAQLKGWLADLKSVLPPHAGEAVWKSLDKWATWAAQPTIAGRALDWNRDRRTVLRALRRQGQRWRGLLSGEKRATDMLMPEQYLRAGEDLFVHSRKLVGQFLSKLWLPLLVLGGVAVGALLLIVVFNQTGTVIGGAAALATSLGITWKGTAATLGKVASNVEGPLWGAELDAAVFEAITNLPGAATTPPPAAPQAIDDTPDLAAKDDGGDENAPPVSPA